ncbi:MAG: HEPN domain-containing protein [Pirellulales bacterium]|nr:HEPN domain-containing protein [Pirellulales bacterium]
MQPITQEWINKAEGDFQAALALLAVSEPVYDAVVFHAQQCAEKYLKARLIDAKVHFPRIHNLGALLDLILPIEPTWAQIRPQLDALKLLGVEVRYPGTIADRDDAEEASETARTTRDLVRAALGI